MKRLIRCRWLLLAVLAAASFPATVRPAGAAEETQRFLEALRERRYFDVALVYLDKVRDNELVDEEFRTTIDYEAGATLISAAQMGRVPSIREKHLDEAQARFEKFVAEHAGHDLVPAAKTHLANLMVERGRIKAERAQSANRSASEKQELLQAARALYQQAQTVLEGQEKHFLEQHKEFPKLIPAAAVQQIEERDQVRRNLLQARLALATVVYEISKTYPAGSDEAKAALKASAEKYHEMYTKYSERLAGLYARMWEGRSYKELGQHEQAFECFLDLLSQPDEPQAFRTLKNKAFVFFLETALEANKEIKVAADNIGRWATTARSHEEETPEGLAIKYLGARAILAYIKSKQDLPAKDRSAFIRDARKYLVFVGKYPGEYQKKARERLRREPFDDAGQEEPGNFAEAADRGREFLDLSQDPNLAADEIAKARREAIKYYRMALGMRTAEMEPDQLNVVRYYLTYLHYITGDLYEAAVLGEFLARRYPNGVGARQGARIALAAYVTLLGEVGAERQQFVNDRLASLADYITKRWEGEPEADEAWMMLIRIALQDGELDKAREQLAKVSPDSPRRAEADLLTGQKLWAAYLDAMRKPEAERAPQAELDKLVQDSRQILTSGIERMRKPVDEDKEEVGYILVASVLSLAQICIGSGDPLEAVKWLDDPKIGAMTLVKQKHAATDKGKFRTETYKAALRAYVASKKLDEAEEAMDSLEAMVKEGGDADADKKLTQIYISLGRQLEKELHDLRAADKHKEAKDVSDGFERFLDRISKRPQGNTFSSLNWVAETFYSLGAGFDPDLKALPPEAEAFYQKARATYELLLKLCEENKLEYPPGAIDSIKIRLARCLRRLGRCEQALDILVQVLKQRNMMIDAQVEAAYTYQAWGKKEPTAYKLAITGGRKAKTKEGRVIRIAWGWGKLAKMVGRSSNPKHREIFFESRYNLAVCRFELALRSGSKKTATLKQAENDILVLYRLYPSLGGKEWFDQFDELLRKIRTNRGQKNPPGLKTSEKK